MWTGSGRLTGGSVATKALLFGPRINGIAPSSKLFSGATVKLEIERHGSWSSFRPVHRSVRVISLDPPNPQLTHDSDPMTIERIVELYDRQRPQAHESLEAKIIEPPRTVGAKSESLDLTTPQKRISPVQAEFESNAQQNVEVAQTLSTLQNDINTKHAEHERINQLLSHVTKREKAIKDALCEIARILGVDAVGLPVVSTLEQRVTALKTEVEQKLKERDQLVPDVAKIKEELSRDKTEYESIRKALSVFRPKALGFISRWEALGCPTEDQELLLRGSTEDSESGVIDRKDPDWKKVAGNVHAYIARAHNLVYPRYLINNILSLVCTHDTLIFAGRPGCGKTALVRALAEAIDSPKPTVIPVKPNWTSSEDLFGYWNGFEGHFVSTEFTDALLAAARDEDHLHFLCLDEMNLARVEYYFADLLSVLEERKRPPMIRLVPESVFRTLNEKERIAAAKYRAVDIPMNVRIIGCVNMDETTNALSPKVLDRVHVVGFPDPFEIDPDRYAKEIAGPPPDRTRLDPASMNREDYPGLDEASSDHVLVTLKDWRELLSKMGAHLSPRLARQAVNYRNCLARFVGAERADWFALNNTILQKILPRLDHDAPEEQDFKQRHAAVDSFLGKLAQPMPALDEEAIPPPQAKKLLQNMYDKANLLPDKHYRFWR